MKPATLVVGDWQEKVISATDKYIIFRSLKGTVFFRSYKELNSLKNVEKVSLETF